MTEDSRLRPSLMSVVVAALHVVTDRVGWELSKQAVGEAVVQTARAQAMARLACFEPSLQGMVMPNEILR